MEQSFTGRIGEGLALLRANNWSGSVDLALKASEILQEAAAADSFHAVLEGVCRQMVRAQPSMAPIVNLCNLALWNGISPGALRSVCVGFAAELTATSERIARKAEGLIDEDGAVLTYSYSRTVLDALLAAHRAGRKFQVFCTESRPVGEGASLARRLAEEGISVRFTIDAALFDLVRRSDVVLVGADAITATGVVNKVGTALVAQLARTFGRRVFVLAGLQKFVPTGYTLPPEAPKPPAEILAEPPPGVEVDNYYFESTPLDWIAGVVTGDAVLAPWQAREHLQGNELHAALRGL